MMDSTRDASLIKGLKPHHHHLLLHSHSHFKGFTAAHVSTEGGDHDDGPVPFLTLRTLSMAFMVSMGGMMFGFDTGIISGFLQMRNFQYLFADIRTPAPHFGNVRSGLIVGLLSIGTLCGSLTSGPLADRYGRKPSIIAWCVVFIVGVVVQISTQNAWYQIIIGRYISGLGIGALSVLAPMYQSEASPSQIRGVVVSTYQLLITLGILIGNLINFGTETMTNTGAWRIPMGIEFLWALILAVGMLSFPESPRYDFVHGRVERARISMTQFYGVGPNHVTIVAEMKQMERKVQAERQAGHRPWHEFFTGPRMAYRTILGATLQALQQLTGANYFFYYGTTIFRSTGLENSFVTQIILGAVNFVSTMFGLWLVNNVGRRKCLIGGALWMFVCFIIFASLGKFKLARADGTNDPTVGGVMIAFSCLFIAAFASTWGPLVWAVTGEMYPGQYRAKCIGIATAANWTFTFLIAFFTPFITGAIGFAYGYVFAGCCLAGAIIVYLFLIESKNRTLEDVDNMYLLHVKPWQARHWVHPNSTPN